METIEKKSYKTAVWNFFKIIAFLCIFAFLLNSTSKIFSPEEIVQRKGGRYYKSRGFYNEPKNSIDSIVIGDSGVYSGIIPMQLYKSYGITTYDAAEGSQRINGAYAILKEFLTCQKPKLVIFEVNELCMTQSASFEKNVQKAFKSVFPVISYHNRWKNMTTVKKENKIAQSDTIQENNKWQNKYKGFRFSNEVISYGGGEYMIEDKSLFKIDKETIKTLDAFVSLCRQNGADILFMSIPCATSWDYSKHNAIQSYADKNGIQYLDMNLAIKEMSLDWAQDSRDGGEHMNTLGAYKTSLYLGKYIKNNFSLPDRTKDTKYKAWEKEYQGYIKRATILNKYINKEAKDKNAPNKILQEHKKIQGL